jgi:peptidoglycan L-alanyl-D-glutamate endopeptidase CwlK
MNKTSLAKLSTCHSDIIRLAEAVDKVFPVQCICGYRNESEQNKAFQSGYSKLKYPNSKHNKKPSLAGDFVPDPDNNPATLDWNDIEAFELMCLTFEQKADELGIKIRLGRDFKFKDYPHCELVPSS